MNEDVRIMISHYIGHAILNARLNLELGVDAREERGELIRNLRNLLVSREAPQDVRPYIDLAQSADFSTSKGVEEFNEKYDKMRGPEERVEDIVKKLFGQAHQSRAEGV